MTVVIFLARSRDIPSALSIKDLFKQQRVTIISCNAEVSVDLLKRGVEFRDSDEFYPNTKTIRYWQPKFMQAAKNWHRLPNLKRYLTRNRIPIAQAAELGIHLYLGEIGHSLLTAQNLLDTLKPSLLYVYQGNLESPWARYQTEQVNLEPRALSLLCHQSGVEVRNLGRESFVTRLKPLLLCVSGLIKAILVDWRRWQSAATLPPLPEALVLGNHYQLANLNPTLLALRKNGVNFLATGKTSTAETQRLTESDIPFIPFSQISRCYLVGQSKIIDTIVFHKCWRRYNHELKIYFDHLHPLIWPLIQPKLWWYFISELPEIADTVTVVKALTITKPKILLTMATADHFSRCFALVAKSQNIPVVELQHGFYRIDIEYPFRTNNYFLIWSSHFRKVLHWGNRHPQKYPIAGYPWFDQYQKIRHELPGLRLETRKQLHITPAERTILILATMPKDLDDDRLSVSISPYHYITTVFNAIKKLPEPVKVIFRPHPSCKAAWVSDLATHMGITLHYDPRQLTLKSAIAASDVVIANFTTALIDTMFIRKPILIHTFHDMYRSKFHRFPTIRYKAVWPFESEQQLVKLLDKAFNDRLFITHMHRSQQKLLQRFIFPNKLPAAPQIVEFVKNFTELASL